MSARFAMRNMKTVSQTMKITQRCMKLAKGFEQMPQLKMKPIPKYNQVDFLSKRVSSLAVTAKMNKAELRRMQAAVMTMLSTTSATVILNLAEVIMSTVMSEEEEEGSSSGVRRRRGR